MISTIGNIHFGAVNSPEANGSAEWDDFDGASGQPDSDYARMEIGSTGAGNFAQLDCTLDFSKVLAQWKRRYPRLGEGKIVGMCGTLVLGLSAAMDEVLLDVQVKDDNYEFVYSSGVGQLSVGSPVAKVKPVGFECIAKRAGTISKVGAPTVQELIDGTAINVSIMSTSSFSSVPSGSQVRLYGGTFSIDVDHEGMGAAPRPLPRSSAVVQYPGRYKR